MNGDFFSSLVLATVAHSAPFAWHHPVHARPVDPNPTSTPRTTQVGVETAMHVLLKNPADHPVMVRLLSLPLLPSSDEYFAARDALSGSNNGNANHDSEDAADDDPLAFARLMEAPSPCFSLHSEAALLYTLPPHSETTVGPVLFTPTSKEVHTGVLLIKNNLTLLQVRSVSSVGTWVKPPGTGWERTPGTGWERTRAQGGNEPGRRAIVSLLPGALKGRAARARRLCPKRTVMILRLLHTP